MPDLVNIVLCSTDVVCERSVRTDRQNVVRREKSQGPHLPLAVREAAAQLNTELAWRLLRTRDDDEVPTVSLGTIWLPPSARHKMVAVGHARLCWEQE